MGAKVHQLGRLIASCSNVVWYDHKQNGNYPWEPYTADKTFTPFHFNRRFKDAKENGVCNSSLFKIGSSNNLSIAEQTEYISDWSEKINPKHFVYPTHESVELCRQIFKNSKEVYIIPDTEDCVERFMKTSINYFVDPNDKDFTFRDLFQNDIDFVRQHIKSKCDNLVKNLSADVFIIEDTNELKDKHTFVKVCDFLEIDFADDYYKVVDFINAYT